MAQAGAAMAAVARARAVTRARAAAVEEGLVEVALMGGAAVAAVADGDWAVAASEVGLVVGVAGTATPAAMAAAAMVVV